MKTTNPSWLFPEEVSPAFRVEPPHSLQFGIVMLTKTCFVINDLSGTLFTKDDRSLGGDTAPASSKTSS